MNANTQAEARSFAALEIADPAKNLILVPLAQLRSRRSRRNVRRAPRQSIPELAASIERVGLLQNLIVVAVEGDEYEVVAGDRRLTALKWLARKRRVAAAHEVPCLLVPDASARTVSLAENAMREAMHPADEFEAFAALVREGRPVEDIAADFGVSPLVVQRRLKLGNVSPRLLADYRAGVATLEQLMALTISNDHAAQEAAFYNAPEWQRGASALRERLTEREIDATHPLARFVGLEAYEAAGGAVRRDLFADDARGTYLADAALLERLARDRLDALAGKVRAEGWAWVEAVPHFDHAEAQAFQEAPRQPREPTAREARRLDSLHRRLDKIESLLEAASEAEDDEQIDTLEQRHGHVADELRALRERLQTFAPDVRAVAGAIVTLDRDGEVVTYRGLLREAEAKALRTLQRVRQGLAVRGEVAGGEGEEMAPAVAKPLSDRLAQRLSAHRTAALQIEVARHPHVALAALVHGMVQAVLQENASGDELPLGVRVDVQDQLGSVAPDWPASPAAEALHALQHTWGAPLPRDGAELFAALVAKPQDALVQLLAICVASTVDVVTARADRPPAGKELAQAVGLDMAAWWTPTAEGYFQHVSKAAILDAVAQYAPSHVTRLSKLKKGEIAREAERLAEGTGWMPALFRPDAGSTPASMTSDEVAMDDAAPALAA